MDKVKTDIASLFIDAKEKNTFLKVCAPMVRYSRLQFRSLVRQYGVDLNFTPMILADSFCRSSKARLSEFSTSSSDTPLIVQFAAKTVHDFVGASQLVYPYADGVDLNCGCPQRWAIKDGYGCSLLSEPDIIHTLVREFKNRLPETFSVSVKIRLLKDLKDTIELCRRLESCGVNFLTIHGRKPWQKTSDSVDVASLKEIKKCLQVPVIANGNIKTLEEARAMHSETECDGVMSAQGILTNPAMFAGVNTTPMSCVENWLSICDNQKNSMTFQCYHHHLVFMLEKILSKKQKRTFNYLSSYEGVHNFLEETFGITPQKSENILGDEINCVFNSVQYSILKNLFKGNDSAISDDITECLSDKYDATSDGKYFKSAVSQNYCDLDNMESSLFNEN